MGVDLLLSFAHLVLRMAFSRAASHWSNSQTFPGLDQCSSTVISYVFPLSHSEFEINVCPPHDLLPGAGARHSQKKKKVSIPPPSKISF